MIPKICAASEFPGMLESCGGMLSQLLTRPHNMTKSASEAFGRADIERHRPSTKADLMKYAMIHFVAMGAHESFGFNKNGDAFTRAELIKCHPTFVKHAYLFREHRNSDPKLAIGIIKASAFNDPMDRAELLVWLDRYKAEKEFEKAAAGKELAGSMACKVAGDVCNICDHFAKRTADYCDHARNHMTRYMPEHRKYAFVFNPNPDFIDYSVVENPADRQARYLAYAFADHMQKAASENLVITGADWAAFYGMTADTLIQPALMKLAAAAVELYDPQALLPNTAKAAFLRDIAPLHPGQFTDREVQDMRRLQPGTLWRELAKRAAVLPFYSFAGYITGTPVSVIEKDAAWQAARTQVAGQPAWALGEGAKFAAQVADQFEPAGEMDSQLDPEADDAIDRMLAKADEDFAATDGPVTKRLRFDLGEKVLRCGAEEGHRDKSAALAENSEPMLVLRAYGVYKAAALRAIEEFRGKDVSREILIAALD